MEDNSVISTDTYTYGNSNWEDQLTKFNNQEITYDMIGNPLTIGEDIKMSWINGRELKSFVDASKDLKINYKYNLDGIRTRKTINGEDIYYYLEGNDIIYQEQNNNILYFIRDDDELIGFKYENKNYYYIKNIQNDIIGIMDEEFNKIVTYEYDSWGLFTNIIDDSDNNIGTINPYRYRSYYYDNETGLYYLGNRYYNPIWGRFINVDSTTGQVGGSPIGHNMYQYAFNNPINFADEVGNWPKWLKKAVAAVAIVTAVTVVAVTATVVASGTVFAVIAVGVAKGAAIGAVSGAVIGAASGAVSNRVKTGSWKDSGKAAINGAANGALSGAITGAVSGGISSTSQVLKAAQKWGATQTRSPIKNMNSHFRKHVLKEKHSYLGKDVIQFTENANNFFQANKGSMQLTSSGNYGIRGVMNGKKVGGFFSEAGQIFSFFS